MSQQIIIITITRSALLKVPGPVENNFWAIWHSGSNDVSSRMSIAGYLPKNRRPISIALICNTKCCKYSVIPRSKLCPTATFTYWKSAIASEIAAMCMTLKVFSFRCEIHPLCFASCVDTMYLTSV